VAEQESIHRAARKLIVKASELGATIVPQASSSDAHNELAALSGSRVIEPDYDPTTLRRIRENSSSLPQNIQAYATNVDGQGHRIKNKVDFDSDDAWLAVKESLWLKAFRDAQNKGEETDSEELEPDQIKVDMTVKQLAKHARLERLRLEAFLRCANPDGSFVQLRIKTRKDLEESGNAYWEVLRHLNGDMARLVHVPHERVRCTPLDEYPTAVDDKVPISLIEWDSVKQHRFFRRYVQFIGNSATWFKQFGDPRVVSRKTGRVYADLDEFNRKKMRDDIPATEIIHFRIEDSGSAYGSPRWMGTLLSVLGSRASDEVNYDYFDNKAIPPMALLVQGGELSPETRLRIENHFRDRAKGRQNFHKVLVVEAISSEDEMLPGEQGIVPRLKFEKLNDAQQGDALFQGYDERNLDKIGSSFRLPRLLRGDSRDFNRATAEAALKFADEQVFEPERNDFDSFMNRVILPALNITLLVFKSLGPRTRDLEAIVSSIEALTKAAAITPNEARVIVSEVVGIDLPPFERPFARQPLPITQLGIMPDEDDLASTRDEKLRDLMGQALRLVEEREEREDQDADAAVEAATQHAQDGVEGTDE